MSVRKAGHASWVVTARCCTVVLLFSCSPEAKVTGDPASGWPRNNGPSADTASNGAGVVETNQPGSNQPGSSTTLPGSTAITGNNCAGVNVQVARIKPWMLFVIDRSGSTEDPYEGSTSRWQALYDSLMAPGKGVISKLESVAEFGVVLFDSGDDVNAMMKYLACMLTPTDPTCADGGSAPPKCPRLITVPPALNNCTAIDNAYRPAGPVGNTPTAAALAHAYSLVPPQQGLDERNGPKYVVLCTDGEPNGCQPNQDGEYETDYQGPKNEVTKAAAKGIKTFVVGIAMKPEAQEHLDELAVIGATGSPAFSPASKDDLVKTISQIVGGAIGCKVKLNGTVNKGKECSGYVNLNSKPLTCNDPNGWKLVDATHVELLGNACKAFLNDPAALLDAGFPCDAFTLE